MSFWDDYYSRASKEPLRPDELPDFMDRVETRPIPPLDYRGRFEHRLIHRFWTVIAIIVICLSVLELLARLGLI